jgi:serine/threonine protein kinase
MALLGYVLVVQPENLLTTPPGVGRYRLYGIIAAGGMATVHYGRMHGQLGFARTVAIKRLHREYARDPDFVAMFMDEARLAVRLHHPNVVETLDVFADGGELFLAMEYVPAVSLALLLEAAQASRELVPPPVAAAIVADVLRGLHAAHEATDEAGNPLDIVHRDVSPQNILVGADGSARVLDFGVAKASGRQQVTRDGQVKGKLAYMSPEQISNVFVTRQSDVFSASIVLWETLTRTRLFQADSASSVLARVLSAPIAAPSAIAPGLPPELDAIALKGLARDLAERYTTAREMAQDLEARTTLATASQVGEWVERLAGDELAKRAAHVAQIESESRSERVSIGTLLSPTPAAQMGPGHAAPRGPERRRGRHLLAVVAGALLSAGALTAVVFTGRAAPLRTRASVPGKASESATASEAASSPAPALVSAPARETATAPAGEIVAPRTVPAAPVSGPRGIANEKPQGPKSKAKPATAGASGSATEPTRCDPPYYVDANGHLIYKPECFR